MYEKRRLALRRRLAIGNPHQQLSQKYLDSRLRLPIPVDPGFVVLHEESESSLAQKADLTK